MFIRRTTQSWLVITCLSLLAAAGLVAADPPWVSKRIAEWTEKDAWQVLSSSPWVKRAAPAVSNGLSAYQRREGGNLTAQGGGKGVGLDDFSLVGRKGAPDPKNGELPENHVQKMDVRWESALPIRAAEIRANEVGAPELEGDEYAIAVYSVPLKMAGVEIKELKESLRKTAMLEIPGRKDLKPSRVAVVEPGGGLVTVVYLFPRSANITTDDKRIEFRAQLGRVFVAQYFYPEQMLFEGKLAL